MRGRRRAGGSARPQPRERASAGHDIDKVTGPAAARGDCGGSGIGIGTAEARGDSDGPVSVEV
jgi:hypothetical protein